jgi:hypothetical protein
MQTVDFLIVAEGVSILLVSFTTPWSLSNTQWRGMIMYKFGTRDRGLFYGTPFEFAWKSEENQDFNHHSLFSTEIGTSYLLVKD